MLTLSIGSTIAILSLGLLTAKGAHDWFHPAALFPLAWAFNCSVALIVAPENMVSAIGPLWILLNSIIFVTGAALGSIFAHTCHSHRLVSNQRQSSLPPRSNRKLAKIALGCSFLGVCSALVLLHLQGISLRELISPREVFSVAAQMSVDRYSGKTQTSGVSQLLLSFAYLAPMLGGTLLARSKAGWDRVISCITLLPSLASFLVESTKSSVLWGSIILIAGYVTTRISLRKPLKRLRIGRGLVVAVLTAIPLLIGVIAVGDMLRSGHGIAGRAGAELISNRTKTYMTGHIAALSALIEDTNLDGMAATPGKFTLAGVYEIAHPGSRKQGVTGSGIYIPTGETNVFSYFWDLISDFTAPGSLFVLFVFSLGGGYAYVKVAEQHMAWNGALCACYSAMLSALTCIFNYNSMILAFFLYGILCARPWRRRGELAWGE